MLRAVLKAVDYFLPAKEVSNDDLSAEFPEWDTDKIAEKTGILVRHIAAAGELSSDLAAKAAQKLFARGVVSASELDFVLLCTQTPDYTLPTTACLLQHRLGIPTSAGALDYSLGCSGFVYGLSLAKGLIETGQAQRVLLLAGETYSKLLNRDDKSVRTIFGDAGAAVYVAASDVAGTELIGPLVFGTDGSGGGNLICETSGFRGAGDAAQGRNGLWMNGPEIFNFTLRVVPDVVNRLLARAKLDISQIDLFVFHQANRYMLDHLRKKLGLPREKFVIAMAQCGNTVSCSIPIALADASASGQLQPGMRVMVVGFGVGYSWAAGIITWA